MHARCAWRATHEALALFNAHELLSHSANEKIYVLKNLVEEQSFNPSVFLS
jgi:hypothetical protein